MTKINLKTSINVFQPTQTTYYLLEAIKKKISKRKKIEIIDMGCGNGVLGISLLKIFKNIKNLVFTDVSSNSLKDCENNIKLNYLKKKNMI